jgi:uncharacterized protein DUF3800
MGRCGASEDGIDYRVYVDIKDTRSMPKLEKLREVLCNSAYDFERQIIDRIQPVRSHEVEQVQLADLLIGTVGYANRGLDANAAKLALVQRMRQRSGYELTRTTLLREEKIKRRECEEYGIARGPNGLTPPW